MIVHVPDLHYMSFRYSYKRNPKQLWLFYTLEPQRYSYCSHYYSISEMDDWFNLTATFKPNSNIQVTYKSFDKLTELHRYSSYFNVFVSVYNKQNNIFDRLLDQPKKRLALWIVSHCHTSGKREEYIKELQKYMEVDVYGWCNSRPVPCDHQKSKKLKESCLKKFFNSYKFYLAFENSKCDYYITEKYWQFYYEENLFDINIVPVVRGPPEEHYGNNLWGHRNFIHSDSFESPKSLAKYLEYLNKNNTAYLEYFKWKRKLIQKFQNQVKLLQMNKTLNFIEKPYSNEQAPFCEICAKLYDKAYLDIQNKTILKITEQFNPVRDCRDDEDPNRLKTYIKKFIGKCV